MENHTRRAVFNAGSAGIAAALAVPLGSQAVAAERTKIRKSFINAKDAPQVVGGYSQAVAVSGAQTMLFVSGQIPVETGGNVPSAFIDQARVAWRNLEAQLKAAAMDLDNLVKVTIFLSDRRYALENRQARQEILGERTPALTVIITSIFDAAWLLEIEAVAMA
jgi:2-iminobutanoate/2-iminopropanoate deaminase